MNPVIFDGKKFAAEKEIAIQNRVIGLKSRGVHPKLASIIIGEDPASKLYVGLKKKAAERVGAELDIYFLPQKTKLADLMLLIGSLNTDDTFQGIMIQMPLPAGEIFNAKQQIVNLINPNKDVDGLQENSEFLHPTSKAVIDILHFAEKGLVKELKNKEKPLTVVVVGSTGMVGKPLAKELKADGYKIVECNTETKNLKEETLRGDMVISCVGVPGLIKGDMVKENAILIDVGSPKGDFSPVAQDRSLFYTPVPGGVGPVTISCLLENLLSAC